MAEMKQILGIIKSGESETVEFKSSFDREAIETIVAFVNTRGGKVFIGVTDSGDVKGVEIGKETLQSWINQVKQNTSSTVIPDIDVYEIKGKSIAVLEVPEYPIKPVACKGRYYKRIKNSNHQLSVSEVVNLHLQSCNNSWDYSLDDRHDENDISLDKVRNLIEMANKVRAVPITDDPLTVLQKYELIRDGKITRAAFFLFMAGESSLTTIELGRFQTETLIKDGARLKTDLFAEVEGVLAFITKHIHRAYIITGKAQREERWDYPMEAVREVVLNAIIHRDYTSSSDSIVKIFDDRIEVYNPGRLPSGLTVEKLLKSDYRSSIRNRKLADMFKEAGLVEKYGSGIRRIVEGFKAYGLPAPKFQEISDGFMVTMMKIPSEETSEETSARIFTAIKANNLITARKIADILGISSRAIEMRIAKLKQEGRLRRIGPTKGDRKSVV